MKLGKLGALFAIAGASVVAANGCVDVGTDIFIESVVLPDAQCVYSTSGNISPRGSMDVLFTREYSAVLKVGSQLVTRGQTSTLRPESNRLQITGAEIQVLDDQARLIDEFTTTTVGFVNPTPTESPGFGLARRSGGPDPLRALGMSAKHGRYGAVGR